MTLGFPVPGPMADPESHANNPVMARDGAIASAHPLISAAGARVLAEGGNAVDAAVAAALVGSVVLPAMCGIGGDLFAIVHRPDAPDAPGAGELLAFMGSGNGPAGVTREWMAERGETGAAGQRVLAQRGPLSPGVPGFVAGAFAMLEQFGTRTFGSLARDAIRLARDGFPLSVAGAAFIATGAEDILRKDPAAEAVFLPGGRIPRPGDLFRQPDLARTIGEIAAAGPESFYRGSLARRIAGYLQSRGGALTAEDFAGHETDLLPPLASTYRGHTIYETRLPTQGFVVLEALNYAERARISPGSLSSAPTIHLQAEALKAAFGDRNAGAADTPEGAANVDRFISKEWAARRFIGYDPFRAGEMAPGSLQDGHTTSLVTADRDGMLVSLIFSVSDWFGSGVVAGDTGVLLNNRAGHCFSLEPGHPNVFEPGKRTMHTLNCYLIAGPDGTPVVAGGTPGGDFQPQWNVQTISALIDGRLDVQAAASLPRWQLWPATYPADVGAPAELRVESRVGEETLRQLAEMGHNVVRLGPWGARGAVQVVARDPETGVLAVASDPRSEGQAIGL
ncbi:MAG: gamma-glutamyltransferase family protein [Chloroflexota bacterium]